MVAVKGMKMPERCEECNFCIKQGTSDYGSFGECLLQKNKRVNCLVWSRDDNCPLVEVVTCKDCKYWDKEEYCKLEYDKVYTSADFCCADGER